jgi:two-component system, cell cycle response regulator DivK
MPPLILLVDDFEDARDLYHDYLTYRGYRVTLASDGEGALREAAREKPDLILLDVRMPGMTGTEAMRRMKGDPALHGVPIIAFTAHAP